MKPGGEEQGGGRPLLDWVLRDHPETPKGRAKQWIETGRVSVAGVVIRKPHQCIPDPGRSLDLHARRHSAILDCGSGWQIHPRVSLLYLDPALAVVNKAPGIISVPAPGASLSALGILADFLAGKLKPAERGKPGRTGRTLPPLFRRLRPLPVHRLDQYTSGIFCMGTNPEARQHLIDQLKARTMKREYVAFVEGRPEPSSGTWSGWLRLSRDELRQHVVPETHPPSARTGALEAVTHYEVLAEYLVAGAVVSKLRLRLATGRKHQIRVQASHAGLPLIGDRSYNPKFHPSAPTKGRIDFPRQALHAFQLTLEHPDKPGQPMTWTAELPKDLRELEAALRAGRF